jgi:transposase-like protein
MLSKWRKDVKDGRLRGRPPKAPPAGPTREIAQLQALERKYAALQEEHDLLKSHPVLGRSKSERFAFIDHLVTQYEGHHVALLCRRYHVTPSGFYAWRRRKESAHAIQDRTSTVEIRRRFAAHKGRYGSPRLHHELVNAGWTVSRRRVARLMRAAGLRAKAVRGYRAKAALRDTRIAFGRRVLPEPIKCWSETSRTSTFAAVGAISPS